MTADAKITEQAAAASAMMTKFSGWFRGDFDNFYQVSQELSDGVAFKDRHEHMHVRLTPIPDGFLAEKGVQVVFANYYYEGRPKFVYRRRFYELTATDNNEIEMRIYRMSLVHNLRVMKCNTDFGRLDMRTLEDTTLYEYVRGAEIYWRDEGERFMGYMKNGGFVTPENGLRRNDDLILTQEDLCPCERVYNAKDEQIGGNRAGIPHKMQRVREDDEMDRRLQLALH